MLQDSEFISTLFFFKTIYIKVDRKTLLFFKVKGVHLSKVAIWYQNTVYEI